MTLTISTPLYYVNDKPHLGSTYTTIACDAIARYYRLEGESVLFITGVDEHGQKIQQTAQLKNIDPKEHCDLVVTQYLELWNLLDIKFDRFIRTTSSKHKKFVETFYKKVKESGDIKQGKQQGWYCVGCEEYKDIPKTSEAPICAIHQKKLEWRDEDNLFFCLTNYQEQIMALVQDNSFIRPSTRRNEIINFVSSGLRDFSISRQNVDWAITVPDDNSQTLYVWFDALLGYLSALYPDENNIDLASLDNLGWPAHVHVIGKDILRFHAVYWPAMLLSAGLKLPKQVFGHGFLTREGQKMGKSLGNVLDPKDLLMKYDRDCIRWYLLSDIKFGSDGDFQESRFIDLINNDLANTIGNLLNRTSTMSRKWFNNKIPFIEKDNSDGSSISEYTSNIITIVKQAYLNYDFKLVCESIIKLASQANTYLNDNQPWTMVKQSDNLRDVSTIIYNVLETSRIIGFLLLPIIPDIGSKIIYQLGYNEIPNTWNEELSWGVLKPGSNLPKPHPVISKLERE